MFGISTEEDVDDFEFLEEAYNLFENLKEKMKV